MMDREIPNTNEIKAYIHCGICLKELPTGIAPTEYKDLEVGWTELGLQVWCRRHNVNVMHIDFEGAKHPANTTRHPIGDEGIPDAFKDSFDE